MAEFEKSRWADSEFSRGFRDKADIYLPLRRQFMEAAISLYAHCMASDGPGRILDLGCGDGLFIGELLKSFSPAQVTLVDGSAEMLAAAQQRLANRTDCIFIQASFQDLLAEEPLPADFHFVYSSLAVHHLPSAEKKRLYAYIHKLLRPGGCFVHYDVVVPPSAKIEKWYLSLWQQWIANHPDEKGGKELLGIPHQYKGNPDNMPDTLASQLEVLEKIGFRDVDCYCKYGIFSLFGGFKES